jgi:hypothetical protein
MQATALHPDCHVISRRTSAIQCEWSPRERAQRVQSGRKRRDRLVSTLMSTVTPADGWAVGDATNDDRKLFAER